MINTFAAAVEMTTNILYTQLFGMNSVQLRQKFGLPDENPILDNNLGDHFGEMALAAIIFAEEELTQWIFINTQQRGQSSVPRLIAAANEIGKQWGEALRAEAATQQIDPLTGEAL